MKYNVGKWFGCTAALLLATTAWADPRPWTFVEDTYPEGQGRLEYEQWVTYSTRKADDTGFSRFDFRQQFEYGLTDQLDVAIFLADWHYEDSDAGSETRFDDFAAEAIYYFTNPHHDPVGLGWFIEAAFGESDFDVTNKLIVHKDFGHWALSYNLVLEAAFENAYNADEGAESSGTLGHAFGASYAIHHNYRLGAEAIIDTTLPDWSDFGDTTAYAGPNFSYVRHFEATHNEFWITITPMFQLTDQEEEADFVVRLIATWLF